MVNAIKKLNGLRISMVEQKLNIYNQIKSMFPEFKVQDKDQMDFQVFNESNVVERGEGLICIRTYGVFFYNDMYENDKYQIFNCGYESYKTTDIDEFDYVIVIELDNKGGK